MLRAFMDRWSGRKKFVHSTLKSKAAKEIAGGDTKTARLRNIPASPENRGIYSTAYSRKAQIELYRFLRDNVPILSAAVWTWVRLCAAKYEYYLVEEVSPAREEAIRSLIQDLDHRIHQNSLTKRGGFRELLLHFFESLFTDGAICGELQLMPSNRRVERFLFADLKTIDVERRGEEVQIFQEIEGKKVRLNPHSLFYYGLNASPAEIEGRSLLAAIPFVTRAEQTLVTDMHRSMRNAGYQRMHVKITPPARLAMESDEEYIGRANSYFDDTVTMMTEFSVDKNPITWDDVGIEYIGPSSKISSNNAWYDNHKAMVEEICAGTNLAPFMLGYNYGTTHNWAEFKYELMLRQVETVQNAAASLLDWIVNVQLALAGIDAEVRFKFDNKVYILAQERANAEKTRLENIITKMNNSFITREEAQRQLERM